MDDRPIRQVMRELGVRLDDVARRANIDMSYVGKMVRGDRPMSREVTAALGELLQEKAAACLTFTAVLLRRHGEAEAAEACDRLWERLHRPQDQPPT